MTGIAEACEIMGSDAKLGDALDPPVTRQSVAEWRQKGFAPLDRAAQIEALTQVPRERLIDPKIVRAVDPNIPLGE